MTTSAPRTKVFISYSHRDNAALERLRVHLKPVERLHAIDVWHDKKIEPGMDWYHEIKSALDQSKVAVLLVSADFLGSEFIDKEEIPPLLAAAEKDGVTILPVIVKPSSFKAIDALKHLQAVNDPARPLAAMTEAESEAEWVNVVERISKAMRPRLEPTAAPPASPAGSSAAPVAAARPAASRTQPPVAPAAPDASPEDGGTDDSADAGTPMHEALYDDLQAMLQAPGLQALIMAASAGDESCELLMVAESPDGSLICEIAANEELPRELRLSKDDIRVLVEEFGFQAPQQRGDRYWADLGPVKRLNLAALTENLIGFVERAFGLPTEDVSVFWQVVDR
jgi:hypothetical protein